MELARRHSHAVRLDAVHRPLGTRPQAGFVPRQPVQVCLACTLGLWEDLQQNAVSCHLQLHVAGLGDVYKMQQPRKRGQWLVQARFDGLLTIMTPIWPDKENLALLLNQVRSLSFMLWADAGWGATLSTVQAALQMSETCTWACDECSDTVVQSGCRGTAAAGCAHVTCRYSMLTVQRFDCAAAERQPVPEHGQHQGVDLRDAPRQGAPPRQLPGAGAGRAALRPGPQGTAPFMTFNGCGKIRGSEACSLSHEMWRSCWSCCPASQRAKSHAACSMTMPTPNGQIQHCWPAHVLAGR